ncbi:hypothetical protein AO501_23165 [Mycobacterium gordonae]|jgi:hypothetical protein|uniref:Uncharacterized protein n=1 Tax=Mycobacterium gordonae TaxID=1778 RepID=A0A0Q2U3U6_MYCGO|nr:MULTISPECIES: hypothetical protein [Mycobacterium]KQH75400.1 hypothetical protein AO501_23165 [Mycobacterium gordonae]MDP7732714.1 hypothetical protein [Mycobacterium sp. TY813]OBJ87454.1 hypothetical protein A9W97_17755 [Mycobacterium gordonae]TDK86594.1 hypothetical protein EI067_29575 [Mycobacterium paragordonae]
MYVDGARITVINEIVEWSRDGALMVKMSDESGLDVQVQLEPAATSWPAEVLADRIARLHRLALMQLRAQARVRSGEESGAQWSVTAGYPSVAEVQEYRQTIDF